jgi:REP element-mobilizing transposase RayT
VHRKAVVADHVVITNYGFRLPNDPRGSWSDYVRSWELFLAGGPATKVDSRQSVAARPHDYQLRQRSQAALVRPPVEFTGEQALAVGVGFGEFVKRSRVMTLASSIIPRHVHLVIDRPPYSAEQATNLLKGAATTESSRRGLHPFANSPYANGSLPTPWARKQWIVNLNTSADILRAIAYVERNPQRDGLRRRH